MTGTLADFRGGCLCGALRYQAAGQPLRAVYCHCRMCRKSGGGPVSAWVGIAARRFRWVRGQPVAYASSASATRGFCGACGSPLTWRHDAQPDTVFLTVGSLDHPHAAQPRHHLFTADGVPWLDIHDDLPRYDAWPVAEEGREVFR